MSLKNGFQKFRFVKEEILQALAEKHFYGIYKYLMEQKEE